MIITRLAANSICRFIYDVNKPFLLLYLVVVAVVYPVFVGSWGYAPELWRAAGGITNPGTNTHHTLIIWGLSALFLALWRRLKLDPFLAVSAAFIVISWHEIEWWVVDWVKLGSAFNPVWLLGGYLYPVAMIVTIFYFRVVNVPWRYIAVMAVFYAGWFAIGFPVSINWTGRTALYDDPLTNWLEVASWAWAVSAFWILERRRLRVWQAKARGSISVDTMLNKV